MASCSLGPWAPKFPHCETARLHVPGWTYCPSKEGQAVGLRSGNSVPLLACCYLDLFLLFTSARGMSEVEWRAAGRRAGVDDGQTQGLARLQLCNFVWWWCRPAKYNFVSQATDEACEGLKVKGQAWDSKGSSLHVKRLLNKSALGTS